MKTFKYKFESLKQKLQNSMRYSSFVQTVICFIFVMLQREKLQYLFALSYLS